MFPEKDDAMETGLRVDPPVQRRQRADLQCCSVFVHKLLCQNNVGQRIHQMQQQKARLAAGLCADADISNKLSPGMHGCSWSRRVGDNAWVGVMRTAEPWKPLLLLTRCGIFHFRVKLCRQTSYPKPAPSIDPKKAIPMNPHQKPILACMLASSALLIASPTMSAGPSGLSSLQAGLSKILPKIDEQKKAAYLKASNEAAKAAAALEDARKDATSKSSKNKKSTETSVKDAEEALAKAQAAAQEAVVGLLGDVDPFLANDQYDAQLVKGAVLADAAKGGHGSLMNQLLGDTELMKQMLVAGGASHGRYGDAMEIYTNIRKASPRAADGMFQRLALATALELAEPLPLRNSEKDSKSSYVDPVKRYLHYEKAYLAGELDPAFKNLSVWEYRMVVNSDAPDEILAWGREMLRNYRPDHITTDNQGWRYSRLVKTDVLYGSQDVDKDNPKLHFYQNIIANGGVCGRRAFFGRFILRSFGIPVWGVTQKAHAAVGRWTPDGWLVNLGAAFKWSWWDKGEEKRSGSDFLLESQARSNPKEYIKVLRAQWISAILGEEAYNERTNSAGGLWSSLAHIKSLEIAKNVAELGPVGQDIAESNESKEVEHIEPAEITKDDMQIATGKDGAITIPAVACENPSNAILIMNSYAGGGQLHVNRDLKSDQSFGYQVDLPKAGNYKLTARVVTVREGQKLLLKTKSVSDPVEIPLPYTIGLWQETAPVTITLAQGRNDLQFTRPASTGRGVTIKEFKLTPVK